jgi:hypothetical protein
MSTPPNPPSSPREELIELVKALAYIAGYCEQVAHDGIMPSQAWFAENAPTCREAAAALQFQASEPSRQQVIGHCGDCGGTDFVVVERCEGCGCEEQVERLRGTAHAALLSERTPRT